MSYYLLTENDSLFFKERTLLKQQSKWLERQILRAQYYADNRQNLGSQELLNQLKTKSLLQ